MESNSESGSRDSSDAGILAEEFSRIQQYCTVMPQLPA